MNYQLLADIFYKGTNKYHKAKSAAVLLDNRLSNTYLKVATDIHFDMSSYLKYFDYDKLIIFEDYSNKIKEFYVLIGR